MKKIKLAKDLYQYQFPPFAGQHFGFNIYALIKNGEALLIDTAFENQAQSVKADLEHDGIMITDVVFSHFHPDHVSGLPMLNSPRLYGSGLYRVSLERYMPLEKHHYFQDITILTEDSIIEFGGFSLCFKLVQGHAICGLFTIINKQFIHVADDIMTSNDGDALLPSVHVSNVKKHIDSLELLKNYASYTLLLSHGNAITGDSVILMAIEQRQRYLKAILNNNKSISITQALSDCELDFLHKEWHEYVYS